MERHQDRLGGRLLFGDPFQLGHDVEVVCREGVNEDRAAARKRRDPRDLRALVDFGQGLRERVAGAGGHVVAPRLGDLALDPFEVADVQLLEQFRGRGNLVLRRRNDERVRLFLNRDLHGLEPAGTRRTAAAVPLVLLGVLVLLRIGVTARWSHRRRRRVGFHLGIRVREQSPQPFGQLEGRLKLALVGQRIFRGRATIVLVQIRDDRADDPRFILDDDGIPAERTDDAEAGEPGLQLQHDLVRIARSERHHHLDDLGRPALRQLIERDSRNDVRRQLQVRGVQRERLFPAHEDVILERERIVDEVDHLRHRLVLDVERDRAGRLVRRDLEELALLGEPRQNRIPRRLLELVGKGFFLLLRGFRRLHRGRLGRWDGRRHLDGEDRAAEPGHEGRGQPEPQPPHRNTKRPPNEMEPHDPYPPD